jgi:predicted kinase
MTCECIADMKMNERMRDLPFELLVYNIAIQLSVSIFLCASFCMKNFIQHSCGFFKQTYKKYYFYQQKKDHKFKFSIINENIVKREIKKQCRINKIKNYHYLVLYYFHIIFEIPVKTCKKKLKLFYRVWQI